MTRDIVFSLIKDLTPYLQPNTFAGMYPDFKAQEIKLSGELPDNISLRTVGEHFWFVPVSGRLEKVKGLMNRELHNALFGYPFAVLIEIGGPSWTTWRPKVQVFKAPDWGEIDKKNLKEWEDFFK